jgi:hypothetical protein
MQREDPASKGGRIGGPKGGEASLHSEKVSASELAVYLKGIDFPASRDEVIQIAKDNGAPENVMNFINRLPSRQYTRANEVEQEFGKMK